MHCTYSPAVFNVQNIAAAKRIILTDEEDACSDERWISEAPKLLQLMKGMAINEHSIVLDYGCGIGRLARALIQNYGCRVVGADISTSMRALASQYVDSERFSVCAPSMLDAMGVRFDGALAVWVLQHCQQPAGDVKRIHSVLNPGASLFIVNEHYRCVPTNVGWVSDGIDIAAMLDDVGFSAAENGELALGGGREKPPYWARYIAG